MKVLLYALSPRKGRWLARCEGDTTRLDRARFYNDPSTAEMAAGLINKYRARNGSRKRYKVVRVTLTVDA